MENNHKARTLEIIGKGAYEFILQLDEALSEAESCNFADKYKPLSNPTYRVATINEYLNSKKLISDIFLKNNIGMTYSEKIKRSHYGDCV